MLRLNLKCEIKVESEKLEERVIDKGSSRERRKRGGRGSEREGKRKRSDRENERARESGARGGGWAGGGGIVGEREHACARVYILGGLRTGGPS